MIMLLFTLFLMLYMLHSLLIIIHICFQSIFPVFAGISISFGNSVILIWPRLTVFEDLQFHFSGLQLELWI
jgi:hypothetical protein